MDPTELRSRLEDVHHQAFGWALSCCDWDRASAEDVLQTTYLKVLDGRAAFGGKSSFTTWLFGVIRRTASEHRRRLRLRRVLPLTPAVENRESGCSNAATDLERSEQTAELTAALRRLPPRQQQVLHLVFYQDMTIADAAAVLQVSLGTARTHYERGKQRLRELT